MAKYICLDIGGTKVLGALMNEKGEIFCKFKKKTKAEKGMEKIEETISKVIDGVLNESGTAIKDISAISAGAPGIIDEKKGVIHYAPNLPWRNYDIAGNMSKRYGVPFYIANDGNAGILGEWKYGVAKNSDYALGLFVGTGLGAGIVLDGKLYTGTAHAAAEIGHMVLNPEGPYCNCGQRGCLEAFCSKVAMTREIKAQIARGRKSVLSEVISDDVPLVSSKFLKKGIAEKDPLTLEVMDRSMYYLAVAAGTLTNIFNPDTIVIGGGVTEACGDHMLPLIKKYIERFVWSEAYKSVKIVNSALGDDAILYGALSLIR